MNCLCVNMYWVLDVCFQWSSIVALRYGVVADRTGMQMMFLEKKMCDMGIVPETFYPSGLCCGTPTKFTLQSIF